MKALILILAATMVACASAPQQMQGMPEVVVKGEPAALKANIIARNIETGWMLDQETESLMTFTKPADDVALHALLGNSSSTPPRYEARYVIVRTPAGTKVAATVDVSTQMPGGQVNRYPLTGHPDMFKAFQGQLDKVKAEIEAG